MKRLLVCVLWFVMACATTTVLSTWRKPGLEALTFKKVVVIVPAKDEVTRREAEDQLVAQLAPTPAVPSYTIVPSGATEEKVKDALSGSDFDGALVVHVSSVDKQATWFPPSGRYGDWGWYDPGYAVVDTYVRVETKIYRLPSDDLLWAASSRTVNPSTVRGLITEVSSTLREELQKEGLLIGRPAP